jgi:glycerophosphoryl diester phosphodiesterase
MKMHHTLPYPLVIAHRGYSAAYPENTISAFNAAADSGAHMIELDVSLSADRQPVVIHDDTVDRTTDGSGAVDALTLKQMERLDAGSWFDPKFHRERIPTLARVLDDVKGRLMVNIEIKPSAFEPHRPADAETHRPADAVEKQVLDLIDVRGMRNDIIVSSFEWRILENIMEMAPRIALGLLSDRPADENLRYWYTRIDGYSWHPDSRVLTASDVDAFHKLGASVFPYAVENEADAQRILAMGVDGLIVDDPGWVLP